MEFYIISRLEFRRSINFEKSFIKIWNREMEENNRVKMSSW
jgi:hypothetical protein